MEFTENILRYLYILLGENETIKDGVIHHLDTLLKKSEADLIQCKKQLLGRYFTDHLTSMPNLYQLRKDLHDNEAATLIVVNIDNFKLINNFYGFLVGDYVLEQVALALKRIFESRNVYRLSSDEFAVIYEEGMGFYDLKSHLETIYDMLKSVVVSYKENKIFVNFTLASSAHRSHSDLFSKVSMALKYAKDRELPFWIYEDTMGFENEYARNLETSLSVREAIEAGRVVPYFQAIMDNKTKKIVKYEALSRLIDSRGAILSPMLFIPIAKKIKLYNHVTKNVIEKSFRAFENSHYEFSVNLSIDDIMNSEIFEFIINTLKSSDAASRVTFELLESEAILDFAKVQRFINEVKRYGAKIAIDDFGDGYSNFSYLTKMSVDYIKIDGSLIENIDISRDALVVVETIVDFAKKLGVKTIAEFVNKSTILDKVSELGIDYSQGFYIDKPKEELD